MPCINIERISSNPNLHLNLLSNLWGINHEKRAELLFDQKTCQHCEQAKTNYTAFKCQYTHLLYLLI